MPFSPDPPFISPVKQRLAKLIAALPESDVLFFLQLLETKNLFDNRKGPRKGFRLPVDCIGPSCCIEGFIINMGEDGAFVKTASPLSDGKELELNFSVSNFEFPVKLIGRVIWGDSQGMGLQFKKIPSSSYRLDVQKVADAIKFHSSLNCMEIDSV